MDIHHCDLGNRVLFPNVVLFKLGGCFNSGGGGRLGAQAHCGHPFADLPKRMVLQNSSCAWAAIERQHHCTLSLAIPAFCCPCPVRSLGPCIDTPYLQPDLKLFLFCHLVAPFHPFLPSIKSCFVLKFLYLKVGVVDDLDNVAVAVLTQMCGGGGTTVDFIG
jgi:hypothetical protein